MCDVPNLSVISPKIRVKRANLSVRRRPSPCSRVRRRIAQAEALGRPAGTGSLKRIIVDAIDFGNLGILKSPGTGNVEQTSKQGIILWGWVRMRLCASGSSLGRPGGRDWRYSRASAARW